MIAPETLTIRHLPKSKKMAVDEKNPIQQLRAKKFTLDEEDRLAEIGTIYGSAMPMMMRYERAVLGQPERLPGLRSSFMTLESNLGRLDKLDFEDVFGRDNNLMKMNAHDVYLSQFN